MRVLLISADRTSESGVAINLGDALLTDALARGVRERDVDVEVADFGGKRHEGGERRLRLRGLRQLFRATRNSDAVIIGGGTLLQDDAPTKRFAGLPRLMFASSLVGWIARRPVIFFGVGCDPVTRWDAKLLLRLAIYKRPVWVRDEASARRCRENLGADVKIAADVSLLALDDLESTYGGFEAKKGLVVALNRSDVPYLSVAIMNRLKAQFAMMTFLSMDQGPDADSLSLDTDVSELFDLITSQLDWEDAAEACGRSEVVLASRMHALYLSAMVGSPVTGLRSSAKLEAFIDEFEPTAVMGLDAWQGTSEKVNSIALRSAAQRVEAELDQAITLLR